MKPWEKYQANDGPWAKYAAPPAPVADTTPEAAKRPTANVFGYEMGGETDAGFSPAAVLIAAGRLGDRVVSGAKDVKNFAQFAINRVAGSPKHAAQDLDALMVNRQMQEDNDRQYKHLTDIHPGSTQIGEIAPLLPLGPKAQLAAAALEYGTLTEKALRVGAVAGSNALAMGAGKAKTAAANRATAIEESVKAKAAEAAAAETASARSLAGRTAQDAYKQMDWLAKLDAGDKLTEAQATALKALREELAGKAQEKLLPAISSKEEAALLFKEMTENEAERAAKIAAEKLSTKEAKSQAMARAKRYWPGVAGALVGNAILPGVGGAAAGLGTGLAIRPTIHALRRLAQNPAVQYQTLQPLGESALFGQIAKHPEYAGLLGYYFANQN